MVIMSKRLYFKDMCIRVYDSFLDIVDVDMCLKAYRDPIMSYILEGPNKIKEVNKDAVLRGLRG
jgi:hypothetical protein